MRKTLAILAAKLLFKLTRLMGHKGTNMGGELALRLYPNILDWFESQVKDKIIFVTGTNGKTSTNNMLYSIIDESGSSCVSNRLGANLDSGLTSAFINSSNWLGYIDADCACLEVDEASLTKVLAHIRPHMILFTNIFRDQLDRYSEIDALLDKIRVSLEDCKDTLLIINADDPSLVNLGEALPLPKKYYGVKTPLDMGSTGTTRDSLFCKQCGHRLQYEHFFYGQLGHYFCENCGFKRPDPDFYAEIEEGEKRKLKVFQRDGDFNIGIDIDFDDSYSIYNMMAAISCGAILGKTSVEIQKGLESYRPQIGRMEKFYMGKPVILNLAKNPVGFDESMKIVAQDESKKTVAIGINDLPQDGRDVSWLWDTNFEILQKEQDGINQVMVFGKRRYDMALRLKYAGIDQNKIIVCDSIQDMVDRVEKDNGEVGYILLNYSLLFETQKLLKRRNAQYGVSAVPSIS